LLGGVLAETRGSRRDFIGVLAETRNSRRDFTGVLAEIAEGLLTGERGGRAGMRAVDVDGISDLIIRESMAIHNPSGLGLLESAHHRTIISAGPPPRTPRLRETAVARAGSSLNETPFE
jgi:hypothetical protein